MAKDGLVEVASVRAHRQGWEVELVAGRDGRDELMSLGVDHVDAGAGRVGNIDALPIRADRERLGASELGRGGRGSADEEERNKKKNEGRGGRGGDTESHLISSFVE